MDIEQLNKSQIVLLTLLVSFVTSIATGIVTVSLVQQAPPAITQTVNRVVEHTVEKIVPGQSAAAATPVTQTVVVKETDAIANAVSAATPAIVRVYSSEDTPQLLGLGVVIGSGMIAVDASAIGDAADAVLDVGGSVHVRAFVTRRDAASGIALMQAATTTPAGAPIPAWKPISFAAQHPVLGESVVSLAGKTVTRLGQGIITTTSPLDKSPAQVIDTNIPADAIMAGSALIDTDGSLIGLSTGVSRATDQGAFISADALTAKDSSGGQQ